MNSIEPKWDIQEDELLKQIRKWKSDMGRRQPHQTALPSNLAIIDDLEPRVKSEVQLGRLLEIRGISDNGYAPILLRFEIVQYVSADLCMVMPDEDRDSLKKQFTVSSVQKPINVQSFHYLLQGKAGWHAPGAFRGPLLNAEYWNHFKRVRL